MLLLQDFIIGENLVALADANNGQVDIWQQSVGANGWYSSSINLRSGNLTTTEQSKISYYFVDGAFEELVMEILITHLE